MRVLPRPVAPLAPSLSCSLAPSLPRPIAPSLSCSLARPAPRTSPPPASSRAPPDRCPRTFRKLQRPHLPLALSHLRAAALLRCHGRDGGSDTAHRGGLVCSDTAALATERIAGTAALATETLEAASRGELRTESTAPLPSSSWERVAVVDGENVLAKLAGAGGAK